MRARLVSMANFCDCGGPYDLAPEHMSTCWEALPTTPDEVAVIDVLQKRPELFKNRRLLHIGVGNGHLLASLEPTILATYLGVTISLPEAEQFAARFGACANASVVLLNKYDDRAHTALIGPYDLIVDVNLKSYACCEKHFQIMMAAFVNRLAPGGVLVTAEQGMAWGWGANTARAHTPGADPAFSERRVLTNSQLLEIAEALGLWISYTEEHASAASGRRVVMLQRGDGRTV